MTSRQMKMPVKADADTSADDVLSQRKRPELGRYLLQVDRQTKGSYASTNAAQSAALTIKRGHPVVQVSVYDAVENTNTIVANRPNEARPTPMRVTRRYYQTGAYQNLIGMAFAVRRKIVTGQHKRGRCACTFSAGSLKVRW